MDFHTDPSRRGFRLMNLRLVLPLARSHPGGKQQALHRWRVVWWFGLTHSSSCHICTPEGHQSPRPEVSPHVPHRVTPWGIPKSPSSRQQPSPPECGLIKRTLVSTRADPGSDVSFHKHGEGVARPCGGDEANLRGGLSGGRVG